MFIYIEFYLGTFGLRVIKTYVGEKLRQINVYQTKARVEYQILGTRIYLFLLVLSFVIISLSIGFQHRTILLTVESPNMSYFYFLQSNFYGSLSCPCTSGTINYIDIINFSYQLHEFCEQAPISSSGFSLAASTDMVWNESGWNLIQPQLQALLMQCSNVVISFQKNLVNINQTSLVSTQAMNLETFEKSVNTSMSGMVAYNLATLDRVSQSIFDMVQANQFQNQYMTSWKTQFTGVDENYILRSSPVSLNGGDCFCASGKSSCTKTPIFYDFNGTAIILPGRFFYEVILQDFMNKN